ncbi:DoxX family protein [Saccharothrix sp. ST-888]|uniref:DoxX family protein n=1 Tax=Saccharothrix sp. ST-888 TaxID=1427391 RepID=UPI0005ECCF49|nr:DoxX family membrane protein [Saccharothrix sp. ST-888]KJK58243.1 DoxX family protein [Saccharothrix sp. ST-888]
MPNPTAPASAARTDRETDWRSPTSPHAHDVGLLLLRLALGLTMAAHGSQKLFGWFGGGGIDGTGAFFTMSGYPAGKAMAVVAGLTEVCGGLGLAVGLLTPLAGAAVVGTMVNALAVTWGGGFFAPKGVEYELLLTAGAAALALTGPGRIAVDRFLPVLRSHRLAYGAAAVVLGLVTAAIILLLRN